MNNNNNNNATCANFRTSITLNNIGVSLLRKGQYVSARDVFRNSITLIKASFPGMSGSACTPMLSSSELLTRSMVALARCTDARVDVNVSPVSYSVQDIGLMTQALKAVEQPVNTLTLMLTPITICFADLDLDIGASIILYNYGVVLSYMAYKKSILLSDGCNNKIDLQGFRQATKITSLAHKILVNYSSREQEKGQCSDSLLYCTTGLIIASLFQLLKHQGRFSDAAEAAHVLQGINCAIDDLEEVMADYRVLISAAAA